MDRKHLKPCCAILAVLAVAWLTVVDDVDVQSPPWPGVFIASNDLVAGFHYRPDVNTLCVSLDSRRRPVLRASLGSSNFIKISD